MTFLEISVGTLNLFSFVLGLIYAYMSTYTWGGKRTTFLFILLYFIGVAGYYYLKANNMFPQANG